MIKFDVSADFIVVGAGSSGCVLANRLSQDASNRVLLLEAGGKDSSPWIHIPVGYFKTMHNPRMDWCYDTDPDPGIAGRRLDWPRGKVLGGSSSINGLLYVRGQAEDYDRWRDMGNHGWGYEDVLPYFKRSEDRLADESRYHGTGGELPVSDLRLRRPIAERFIQAAVECGIPRNDDYNGEDQEGVGYFQQTAKHGFRYSTARAFLAPAKKRANLRVETRAHASKLIYEDGRVCGIEYYQDNALIRAKAEREVILSAGAIGSPQIMQCSGFGAGELLQSHGIGVINDLGGVGANLQDHLQVRLVYKTSERTLNDELNNPLKKLMVGLQYVLNRTGPMTLAASQVAIFARSNSFVDRPDVQFHFQPLSADKPGEGTHHFSAFTASVCQLRPESRGTIRIKSSDARDYPSIQPNYLSSELDCQVAIDGVKLARRIADAPALKPVIVEEFVPGSDYQTQEELLSAVRLYSQTIYHPVGTCKMGTGDDAVVDPRLRVNGTRGLRIADASIMPEIPSGNTNAPAIMIAEKAAQMILEDAK